MLVSMKDMLQHALRDGYAVGQFNINNLEWVGAVLSTAQQCRSPVILGVSGGTVKHMLGLKCIHDIVVNAMEYLHIDVPVALHLDHGTSREACEAAIAPASVPLCLMARICRSGKTWPLLATW